MSKITSFALMSFLVTLVLGVLALSATGGVDADGATQMNVFVPLTLGAGILSFVLLGLAAATGFFED